MSKNKQAAIWATVALAMLIIGVVTYERQRPKRPVSKKIPTVKIVSDAPKPTDTSTSTPVTAPANTGTSTPASAPAVIYRRKKLAPKTLPLDYGEAVNTYGNKRIQFDQNCRGIPSHFAMSNPSTVMLDNRSDKPQNITIGGKSYLITAYNYLVITLDGKTLPTLDLFVNCNNQMNTAEIILN